MGILRKVTVKRLSSISEVNGYEEINEIKQLEMKGGRNYYSSVDDCCETKVNNMDGGSGGSRIIDDLPYTAARDATYVANAGSVFKYGLELIQTAAAVKDLGSGSGSSGNGFSITNGKLVILGESTYFNVSGDSLIYNHADSIITVTDTMGNTTRKEYGVTSVKLY